MKSIEVNYTIEIDKVIAYWQSKLERLWGEKQQMNKELEMIDNTINYLKALKQAMSNQVEVIIQDETGSSN